MTNIVPYYNETVLENFKQPNYPKLKIVDQGDQETKGATQISKRQKVVSRNRIMASDLFGEIKSFNSDAAERSGQKISAKA